MFIPKELQNILDHLIKQAARPIIVGGFIRDYFLKIDSKDIDIEVYGFSTLAELSNILEEFGDVNLVGKSFGVIKLKIKNDEYDFSFPRSENKTGIGHKGFDVNIDGFMSYKDGAKRRDFTINSIGYDYKQKSFLDPFGGIKDIENKVLKHIDEKTFCEDPLRVYRGVQFSARFELNLDKSTIELFKKMVKTDDFKSLSKERIFEEYKKLLLKSKKPSIGLKILNKLKIEDIKKDSMVSIDNLVKIKSDDESTNLVLFFYFIDDTLKKISGKSRFLKEIERLKVFKIPKIFKKNNDIEISKEELLKEKYILLKNMPKALFCGKDLIKLGVKPSKDFSIILDKVYQLQLDGKIDNKNDAINYVKKLLFLE